MLRNLRIQYSLLNDDEDVDIEMQVDSTSTDEVSSINCQNFADFSVSSGTDNGFKCEMCDSTFKAYALTVINMTIL